MAAGGRAEDVKREKRRTKAERKVAFKFPGYAPVGFSCPDCGQQLYGRVAWGRWTGLRCGGCRWFGRADMGQLLLMELLGGSGSVTRPPLSRF